MRKPRHGDMEVSIGTFEYNTQVGPRLSLSRDAKIGLPGSPGPEVRQ